MKPLPTQTLGIKSKKIIQWTLLFFLLILSKPSMGQNAWNTTAKFDGNAYIAHWESSVNSINTTMTVEFWVKPKEILASYTILGKQQFRIMTNSGKVRVQISNSTWLYSVGTLDSQKWSHVAVVIDANNNTIAIYINGNYDTGISNFSGAFTGTSDSLIIGKSIYASNLQGELDEVRIWKTARSSSDIQNNYQTHIGWYGFSFYDNNLIFVETYDFDVYAQGFYMPYGGTVGAMSGTLIGNDPSTSVVHNNAMYFNGSSNVECYSSNDPDVSLTGPITVETWIYPTSISTKQTILDLTSGGTGGFKLSLESDGAISWLMTQIGNTSITLQANRWYHIAVVCGNPSGSSQIASIYINGKYITGYNYSALVANTGKLRIGQSHSNSNGFIGYIDEVRISNYAKSVAELNAFLHTPVNYVNTSTAPKSTVAYNFDGNCYSGTRKGYLLKNNGARYSYASEPRSPLFFMGYQTMTTLDSMRIKHAFANIPESGTAGYTYDTIEIQKNITLDENKIKVFLSLNHAAAYELRVELISPAGDSTVLFNSLNFGKSLTTIFSNSSKHSILGGYVDFSPIIKGTGTFAVFNGKNGQGVWKLKITDLNNGNAGVLNSWGLLIDGAPYINGVNAIKGDANLAIYPNPANDKRCTVETGKLGLGMCQISVKSLTGQIVYENLRVDGSTNIPLNLDTVATGTYVVSVISNGKTYQTKLVIP